MLLPSKHLLSASYKTLPSKNPSKNLVFTENPYKVPSKNPSKKHMLLESLLRTLLRVACCCMTPLVCTLFLFEKITLLQKQKSDEESDRSVIKSDQNGTEGVPKTRKSDRTPLPTSFCGTLRKARKNHQMQGLSILAGPQVLVNEGGRFSNIKELLEIQKQQDPPKQGEEDQGSGQKAGDAKHGMLAIQNPPIFSGTEKQPKHRVFGRDIPGTSGTQTSGYPEQKLYASGPFCSFRQGVAGMSRDLGRDVPDLEKLYARKLWADFPFPIFLHYRCRTSME